MGYTIMVDFERRDLHEYERKFSGKILVAFATDVKKVFFSFLVFLY